MRRGRTLLVAPVFGVLLAGCATDGRAQVRDAVEGVTAAANERDADGVRDAVDDLLAELDSQVASGELQSPEAARVAALARQVRDSAALVDQAAIDAEREAQEEAERKAQEEADRKAQEEADRKAEEERRKAEEEARKKAADEAKNDDDKGKGDDDGNGDDG